MEETKKVCRSCGSKLVVELGNSLHCNACGEETPIVTSLSGTPLNPIRSEVRFNPMRLGEK
jgi:hypothetical protein